MTSRQSLSSFSLRLIAMAAMLIDHIRYSLFPSTMWLSCIGRISFPIFAFLLVEGFFHTKNLKKYFFRLLLFAFLSEIPFDLFIFGRIFSPMAQNVLFTLALSLAVIAGMEWSEKQSSSLTALFLKLFFALSGVMLGFFLRVDYLGFGVVTVLIFYTLRRSRFFYLTSFFALFILNVICMSGWQISFSLGTISFLLPIQLFALFSLPFIWRYSREQGLSSKSIKYAFYVFYPLHLLILALIRGLA